MNFLEVVIPLAAESSIIGPFPLRLLVVCGVFLLSLLTSSCSKLNPTQPPPALDTTTHDVAWQVSYLGDIGANSQLLDVAIVNDTLAYAVGEIYLKDSTGQIDPIAYGVAIWNGVSWQVKKLHYNGNTLIAPIRGLFPSGPNDIWLAAGGVFHWDGSSAQADLRFSRLSLPDPNATIERVWDSGKGYVYGVGNAGTVVSYNGSSWQALSSGTMLDIKDIFGGVNPKTLAGEIIAVAGNPYAGISQGILGILGTSVTSLSTSNVNTPITGTWFVPGERYYVVGGGIYQKSHLDNGAWTQVSGTSTNNFTRAIRGAALNDLFVVGDFGEVLHYNGNTWRSYLPQTAIRAGAYYSVAVRDGLVLAVGEDVPQAIVLIGRRM